MSPTNTFGLTNNIRNSGDLSPVTPGFLSSIDPGSLLLDFKQYDSPLPYLRFKRCPPKLIGDYSIDGKGNFLHDRSQLKFFEEQKFKDPRPGINSYKR